MSAIDRRATAMAERVETLRLRLVDEEGRTRPREAAVLTQLDHDFGFGCTGFELRPEAPDELTQLWLRVFNMATLPFYWRWFEPEPGAPDTERLLRLARGLRERGVRLKGHPLLWHTLAPEWLKERTDDAVDETIRARITREVGDFRGIVDHWDAINETVILPVFTAEDNAVTRLARARGRLAVIRLAVDTARSANPGARLVLNDFDLTPAFEDVIEECLEAGLEIDAIGLQTHMHKGYRGEEAITEVIERFSRFGLPLQMTETTLLSGDLMPGHIVDLNDHQVGSWPSTPDGEARQAEEIVSHYRTVLSQPAVESLTYWGLGDRGAWLGAPAGLVRADGTPKPAYAALSTLITEEWWVRDRTVQADGDGVLTLRGFAGRYRVDVDGAEYEVTIPRGGGDLEVRRESLGRD